MSIVSTRSRYGLRFLIDLAGLSPGQSADVHSIALRQEIPEAYLAKLAPFLLAAGFVRSIRGAKGGYALARPASEIDLYSVVEAMEGGASLLECTGRPESCSRASDCGARELWAGLEATIKTYLSGKTLAGVAGSPSQPEYFL